MEFARLAEFGAASDGDGTGYGAGIQSFSENRAAFECEFAIV
jgi:hypothetical protein